MTDSLLHVEEISKRFSTTSLRSLIGLKPGRVVQALDNVSFTVSPGGVTALLGPNGAGKTTLINVICDLVRPDRGSVSVCGHAVDGKSPEARRHVGLVTTNDRSFFWRLTGRHNLEFFAALYDLPRHEARRRASELLDKFGLGGDADRLFRTYSSGMKKRLSLARAMLHDPPVLLMDEATNSLDAQGIEELIQLVKTQIVTRGKCVLWATHRLEEVTGLCDRVVLLWAGRVHFYASAAQFAGQCRCESGYRIELKFPPGCRERISGYVRSIGGILETTHADDVIVLPGVDTADRVSEVLRRLLDSEATVVKVEPASASLGQVFNRLREPAEEPSSSRPQARQ